MLEGLPRWSPAGFGRAETGLSCSEKSGVAEPLASPLFRRVFRGFPGAFAFGVKTNTPNQGGHPAIRKAPSKRKASCAAEEDDKTVDELGAGVAPSQALPPPERSETQFSRITEMSAESSAESSPAQRLSRGDFQLASG